MLVCLCLVGGVQAEEMPRAIINQKTGSVSFVLQSCSYSRNVILWLRVDQRMDWSR